ncbi:peroxidasin-like isoform X1 [Acropora millepora]|uniref:peroxidasin-like isoform X1 n=2 Tax=Acropora millepora TaxID=45264 RepID=UPI001CF26F95|nr:peroxidasin-like isoform X1 [Acropora millepora]
MDFLKFSLFINRANVRALAYSKMRVISFLFTIYLIVSTSEARGDMSTEDATGQAMRPFIRRRRCSWITRLVCLRSPYRTFDGRCNNLCDPTLGMANTPMVRLPGLRPPTAYEGNKFAPRQLSATSTSGRKVPLPNARRVSVRVFVSGEGDVRFRRPPGTPQGTHLVMIWGQFLDHDLALTALTERVSCGTNAQPCPNKPDDCIGIDVDRSVRLARDPSAQCIPLRRATRDRQGEQRNILTHFIDASQVYGSSTKTANELRDRSANLGLMDVRQFLIPGTRSRPILPRQRQGFCRSNNPVREPCFRAGDDRPNENQGLTAMHTVWVREHNRIARILHTLNPTWNDERLFQEARKIVIAEIQHITYNEWLPVFFSSTTRRAEGILLEQQGFFRGYSRNVSPAIINSFATAALRFGHSLVRGDFRLVVVGVPPRRQPRLDVSDFFNPSPLYQPIRRQNPYGLIMKGLRSDRMRIVDHIFSPAVRERLIFDDGLSGDLTAINVQRGRDHGLPPYVEFLKACGKRVRTFGQLRQVMSFVSHLRLRRVYRSVLDIDLFAGAMNEFPLRGSAVGFTFGCILTQQFRNLRRGDRFWYERNDQRVGFTLPQLTQIRKVTMARVLCDNVDGYRISQLSAFVVPSTRNIFRRCSGIPAMDFSPFKSFLGDESNAVEDAAVVEADSALTNDKPEMEPILNEPEVALTPDETEAALFDDAVDYLST